MLFRSEFVIEKANYKKSKIHLLLDKKAANESYILNIDEHRILISGDEKGILYGLFTLIQLIHDEKNEGLSAPCVSIKDTPRFQWRGMHLDVSRHFFQKEFIKKYIDFLAFFKMNIFHWHLTDDQGWRIEIKKYPLLTKIGAFRNGTLIGHDTDFPRLYDTLNYGGFYTQEDIREIVSYADKRGVTIVPEIEMPGHAMAALAAYPELSCTGNSISVAKEWGVFEDVFCAKEETFIFLENVLSEVMDLFPGKYIHIGGDECPKTRWKECVNCQKIIKEDKLKDEHELQSHFIKRIEKFVNSKGKQIIGWDEILEGGLAPNAAVMSWRGTEGGIQAANENHYVVMSPGSHCYFDHYQGLPGNEPLAIGGYTPLEKVYSFEPVPAELSIDKQHYILGAQANLWTEYIISEKQVEYMIFPRLTALSEVVWSLPVNKNFNSYEKRLAHILKLLDKLNVNCSRSFYNISMQVYPGKNSGIDCSLSAGDVSKTIHYSVDGSNPNANSPAYKSPVSILNNTTIKAALFDGNKMISSVISQDFSINKASGKKITLKHEAHKNYNHGGAFTLVDGITGKLPWFGRDWLGFLNTDFEAIIDFGSEQLISLIMADFLKAENSWIYYPVEVEFLFSMNGDEFVSVKKFDEADLLNMIRCVIFDREAFSARYIKVIAKALDRIPDGKSGSGNRAWLFIDEIGVN